MALAANLVRVRNKTLDAYTFIDLATGETLVLAGEQTAVIEKRFTANIDLTKIQILEGTALTTETPPPPGGNQFPANVPPYSVLVTQNTANTFEVVSFPPDSILTRDGSGNIAATLLTDLIDQLSVNLGAELSYTGYCSVGNMVLVNLAPTLIQPGAKLYINGLRIQPNLYTISGSQVIATDALNIAFGGTASDGLGFLSTYWVALDYKELVI